MHAALLISACLALQSPPAVDEASALDQALAGLVVSDGLTEDAVATMAATTSWDVLARQQALTVADAGTLSAAAAFIPRISASAGYTRLSDIEAPVFGGGDAARFVVVQGAAGPVGDRTLIAAADFSFPVYLDVYSVRAGVTVPISDYVWRLAQSFGAASETQRAAQLDVDVGRVKAAADARVLFLSAARLHALALVSEKARTTAETRIGDVQRAFDVGAASSADVLRVQAAASSARLFEQRARSGAEVADAQLRTLVHAPASQRIAVGEDVFKRAPDVSSLLDTSEQALVDEALAQRLEPRVLIAQIAALEAQERSSWAGLAPRLDLTAASIGGNPHPRFVPAVDEYNTTWEAGALLSWTPSDIPAALATSSSLHARAQQLLAQKNALLDGIRVEIATALAAARDANVALTTTTEGRAAAEASYRARADLYQAGRATLVELADAETELLRARVEAVNAHVDARIAVVRLARATGRDVAALAPAR